MSLIPEHEKCGSSFNINQCPPIRKLFSDPNEESCQDYQSNKTFRVYLRIKPTSDLNECMSIVNCKSLVCKPPPNSKYRKPGKVEYEFSYIFGPKTTQQEVFSNCVLDCVEDVLAGQNSLIFAYGTTNAGKTFTVQGSEEFPGIIPRALFSLFSNIRIDQKVRYKPYMAIDILKLSPESSLNEIQMKNDMIRSHKKTLKNGSSEASRIMKMLERNFVELKGHGTNSSVWISFIEVYNDMIFDLLDPSASRKHLEVKGVQDNFYVKGLKKICASNAEEAYVIYQCGRENLNVASTRLNDRSSRSHCIFTIDVINLKDYHEPTVSRLCICDLAGIERQTKVHNTGQRLTESSNINGSLFQLNRCLRTIRENQAKNINQIIPYRHSKLTKLFHSALDNRTNDKIVMIVNINPAPILYDETQQVLKVCSTAKEIKDKPGCIRMIARSTRFSNFIYGPDSRSLDEEQEDEYTDYQEDSTEEMSVREVQKLRETNALLENENEKLKMKLEIYVKDDEESRKDRDRVLEKYRKMIDELEIQRQRLRSELKEARRTTVFERAEGNSIKQELLKKDSTIEELEKKVQEYELKQSRKSSAVQITVENLLEKDMKIKDLESLLDEVRKEYLALNERWEIACNKVTDLETEINEKNELTDYLGESNYKKDKFIEELEHKIEGLEEKLSEDTRDHEKILTELESARDKYKSELLKADSVLVEQKSITNILKTEIEEYKQKVLLLEFSVAEQKTVIDELNVEKTKLREECLKSEQLLAEQKILNSTLQHENQTLWNVEPAKKSAEAKQKLLQEESDSLKAKLADIRRQHGDSCIDFPEKCEILDIKDDADEKGKDSETSGRRYNTRKQNVRTPGKENKCVCITTVGLRKKGRAKEKIVPLGDHALNDSADSLESSVFRNISEKDGVDESIRDITVSGKKKLFPCSPMLVDLTIDSVDKEYSNNLDSMKLMSQNRTTPAQTVKSLRKKKA